MLIVSGADGGSESPDGENMDQGVASEEANDTDDAAAIKSILKGAVAMAVYRQAIAAFPQDLELRCRILKVLDGFTSFDGKAEITALVVDGIQQEFGKVSYTDSNS